MTAWFLGFIKAYRSPITQRISGTTNKPLSNAKLSPETV
jgi:hypothetical protein